MRYMSALRSQIGSQSPEKICVVSYLILKYGYLFVTGCWGNGGKDWGEIQIVWQNMTKSSSTQDALVCLCWWINALMPAECQHMQKTISSECQHVQKMQPKLKNFFTKAVVGFQMRSEMVSMSTSSKLLVNLVCHTLLFMLVFSMSINPTTRDIRTNNFSHHLDKMFSSSGLNILDQLVTPFVNGLSNNVPKFSIQLIKCHVETGSIYFSSAILTLSYPHPAALTQNGPRCSTVLLSITILTTLLHLSRCWGSDWKYL